jgi:transcriptional regulator with XRE-family HTH domain
MRTFIPARRNVRRMTRGPDLTPEQNERVKAALRELLKRFGNQLRLAPKLGVHQSTLSGILGGRTGASYQVAVNVARLMGVNERQILEGAEDERPDRRGAAAELAREDGVGEEAIESVLRDPVAAGDEHRSTLWWAIRMKHREAELLTEKPKARGAAAPAMPRGRKKSG